MFIYIYFFFIFFTYACMTIFLDHIDIYLPEQVYKPLDILLIHVQIKHEYILRCHPLIYTLIRDTTLAKHLTASGCCR